MITFDANIHRSPLVAWFWRLSLLAGLLAALTADLALATNSPNSRSPLGANIAALSYWSTEWAVIDIMKRSGKWLPQCNPYNSTQCTGYEWDTGETLDLDENGWVRSLPAADDSTARYRTVATLMLQGDGGAHPTGLYTVLYEGEGTLEYEFDATKISSMSESGHDVIEVRPGTSGILLKITATDPNKTGNYLRNIQIIPPGGICDDNPFKYSADITACQEQGGRFTPFTEIVNSQRFHPLFLRDLRSYRVIRFMEFLDINNSTLVEWTDRPRLESARWSGDNGAPLELALDLSRQLNADPWVNIPVQASDDYIQQFAQLAKSRLKSNQRIYVEYGNEIWNTAFSAGAWIEQQALQHWPDQTDGPSAYTRRINEYGMRSAQACALWKQEWGEDSQRVRCVMGGMAANPWVSEQALQCPLWAAENGGHSCAEVMDALAIAPYFGSHLGAAQHTAAIEKWTRQRDGGLKTLFQELVRGKVLNDANNLALPAVYQQIDQHKVLADRYHLALVAYEGGQHLAGIGSAQDSSRLETLFVNANRASRMGALYTDYLNGWRAHGGQLFVHFNSVSSYGKFGSWGAKEYQTQANTPKYNALERFITANPCWWNNCAARVEALD